MPALYPVFLVAALESAINRYIALDPDASLWLNPLAGKTIALELTPGGWTIYLCPTPGGIQLLQDHPGPVDTTLRGSPLALVTMGLSESPLRSLFSGEVTVEGDSDTARRFRTLFRNLDIDWEEQLSRVTGDIAAHELGNLFRAGRDWTGETLETFRLNLAEYLQEETRVLPAPAEINGFYDRVDQVRADAERLEARIARLKAAQEASPDQENRV